MSQADPRRARPARAPWRTIYFRLEAPEAHQVSVVGDFNNWNTQKHPLCKNVTGIWECPVPLPAGRYTYCFVIDGVWRPDPQCQQRVRTPSGGEHSILEVKPTPKA